ncbi:MAG: hypothetical protein QOF01_3873, partial [Thermomicrobiales bacterium]|nr:hypothetical protein [Thermomicrobiales bacterium]
MRILLVHNRYQQQGGEDAVFEAEANLLEQRGHNVTQLLFDNDDIPAHRTPLESVRLGLTTVWSRLGVARVSQAIKECRPQVAHFHNTLPLVSPGAYSACRAAGVAVVQTLHNYRLICPSANLLRNNRPCEDCLRRTPPWPGVVHACYRGSRLQTSAIASMLSFHRLRGTWQQDVDLYIALSQFSKAKFVEFGIEPEQIVIKPNFVDDVNVIRRGNEDFFLFVGRLSKEKGIDLLLNAWVEERIEMPLHMVGDGPLESLVARTAKRYS